MKAIYIAGAISNPNTIQVFTNLRIGIKWTHLLMHEGYAVFPVFCDFILSLQEKIELEQYYECSKAWLAKADAVFVIPNSIDEDGKVASKGVKAEMDLAVALGIPIFASIAEMNEYFCNKK